MKEKNVFRRIGITGGIASGKSTVTTWLKTHGYPVWDADAI
ncbi:dephospho-CoA kinase [Levyella massiliensis]|nr:dephospho-CoA kinase [Levyella massiliensis]